MLLAEVLVNGVALGASLALVAIGLTLIFSILRVVNFTHGILYSVGAYGVYFLTESLGLNYFVAAVGAVILAALVGVVCYALFLNRFRGMLLEGAVVAIGLSLFLESLGWELVPGAPRAIASPLDGVVFLGGIPVGEHRIFVVCAACALILALAGFVRFTRTGRAMRALQQDDFAAELQGIDAERLAALTFSLSAALAGLAGALMAPLQSLLPNMGNSPMLLAFVIIILGGMGSILGSLVAAFIIGLTQSGITTYWSPQAALGVSFLVAMAILVVRPRGLFGHD
jgi:branched-chain amino acid transport system permease protein